MVICPKCGAKLPDWQGQCQFCQEHINPDIHGYTRPGSTTVGGTPKWVWPCYYAVSIYFILEGVRLLLYFLLPVMAASSAVGRPVFSPTMMLFLVPGVVMTLFGAGLLARVEIVRGIANVVCWILIILGFLSLAGSVMIGFVLGPLGLLLLFLSALRIATAGFMIYLIGETDRYAPNF